MTDELGVTSGQVLHARFRLRELIGRGGMGSVWSAEDLHSASAPVALKIILPKRLNASRQLRKLAVGRFMREAQAMRRLRNPHVAHVVDHGRDGELIYIAMELMAGESLQERLKRKRNSMPPPPCDCSPTSGEPCR